VVSGSEQVQLLEATEKFPLPFLKWAGGKGSLLTTLLAHVPDKFSKYCEPFLGGGALFFALFSRGMRFRACLSDTNGELISAYKVVKERPEDLIRVLVKIQNEYDRSENVGAYYYDKRRWNPASPVDSAARLVFLNKTCFNGLYRVNSRGEFNVPFGRYRKPKIVDPDNIRAVSRALRETWADLQPSDYKKSISKCGNSDFVYLDPPYQPKSVTSSFTSYTAEGFSEKDQRDLAVEFGRLVDDGCTVLLSNSDTPLTRRLYAGFEMIPIIVNRPINSVGSGRTGYSELIILGTP
jgi:DNA adenine methylase